MEAAGKFAALTNGKFVADGKESRPLARRGGPGMTSGWRGMTVEPI